MHPLLECSRAFPISDPDLSPSEGEYDLLLGAWVDTDSGRFLVDDDDPDPPRTKKNDVETGEDQKGY